MRGGREEQGFEAVGVISSQGVMVTIGGIVERRREKLFLCLGQLEGTPIVYTKTCTSSSAVKLKRVEERGSSEMKLNTALRRWES